MKVVIFAGGVGTRLWPLSRKNTPKQFEKILGDKSTLQLAAERLQPDISWNDIYVATGKAYVEIVRSQLPLLPSENVIGEPEMRDVGPAVALMAGILAKEFPQDAMAILWSDHLVKREDLFRKVLLTAGAYIEKDPEKIVFVGQKPRFASQNLGWIEYGETAFVENGIDFHLVSNFKYRPDRPTAENYFQSGHHAWNLGYFVTTPNFLLRQYAEFAPQVYEKIEKITSHWGKNDFYSKLNTVYPSVEKIHFDNAILERLDKKNALVISENIEWSDIGAWEALKEALVASNEENLTKGKVMVTDSRDSLVYNYTNQMVIGIDLSEMLIINTDDVTLVCPKDSVPKIKKLVESLAGTEHEGLT